MGTHLSPEERLRKLLEAGEKYIAGQITAEEYHEARRKYGTDWLAVARALAKLHGKKQHNS